MDTLSARATSVLRSGARAAAAATIGLAEATRSHEQPWVAAATLARLAQAAALPAQRAPASTDALRFWAVHESLGVDARR